HLRLKFTDDSVQFIRLPLCKPYPKHTILLCRHHCTSCISCWFNCITLYYNLSSMDKKKTRLAVVLACREKHMLKKLPDVAYKETANWLISFKFQYYSLIHECIYLFFFELILFHPHQLLLFHSSHS